MTGQWLAVIFVIAILTLVILGLATSVSTLQSSEETSDWVSSIPSPSPRMPFLPTPAAQSRPLVQVAAARPFGAPLWVAAPGRSTTPTGRPPGLLKMPPFQEAHWQGIEVIPLTKGLARYFKLSSTLRGVIADDVTAPADAEGFLAADVVTAIDRVRTPDLESFIKAASKVHERHQVDFTILRKGREITLALSAFSGPLGTANGETAPMIRPGSQPPHAYLGPCTSCHRIGNNGQLPVDQGDLLTRVAPPIHAGQTPPHRDRGTCVACHRLLP